MGRVGGASGTGACPAAADEGTAAPAEVGASETTEWAWLPAAVVGATAAALLLGAAETTSLTPLPSSPPLTPSRNGGGGGAVAVVVVAAAEVPVLWLGLVCFRANLRTS